MTDAQRTRPLRGDAPPPPAAAWDRHLVVFMRVVAVLWIIKGLAAWAVILTPASLGIAPFETLPGAIQAGFVAFAVLDLVAAVGLWLTSTWGGVMWLLAVMAHLLVTLTGPAIPGARIIGVVELVLVVAYVVLSWLASRET
jgi:hypothetical protein